MKMKYEFNVEEAAEKPEAFTTCLFFMFGPSSRMLGDQILRCFCSKLELSYNHFHLMGFSAAVKQIVNSSSTGSVSQGNNESPIQS